MDKYFLIKNEVHNNKEFNGNVFTSKEVSDSYLEDYTYTLISKSVLHKMLNAEMQRIEDEIFDLENNMNIKSYIKDPRIKELKERIEIVVNRYNELMNNGDAIIDEKEKPIINVFLSSLNDPEFLKDNKELLNNADLTIILNETEMNTIYRGQNMVTLEETLSGKFDQSDFTQPRKEYKDENATMEKYNLISGDYLKKIQKQIKPKSIVVKESFDSENEYTIDELDIANRKVEEVAKIINSHKELSPYEKFYLAFMYVAKYEYNECKDGTSEISRNLLDVLNNNYIVCAGKANLLKAICDRIGVPCIHRGAELHAICTIGLNDPKYNIYGIHTVDPTNQDFPVLYNEDNELPKNVFISNLNWISQLTYRQREYLIEASGLFYVSPEKMQKSAELFKKADENLYYIDRKTEFESNLYYKDYYKARLSKLVNNGIEVKKNYSHFLDLVCRWFEMENYLKNIYNNDDAMVKNIIRQTEAYKLSRDLHDKINSIEECNLHFYTDPEEFYKDCKKFNIEPTKRDFKKLVREFEKQVMPEFTKILQVLNDYSVNFEQIMKNEIEFCESKITDKNQKHRFIAVDKNVKKIEELIEKVRNNHIKNKIGTGLGE